MFTFRPAMAAALASLAFSFAASAADPGPQITEAYARASAHSGAVFMVITNPAGADDRLIAAASDAAGMVQLHTHSQDANGVMQMLEVPEGFVIPASGEHALARGGDHVMMMDLNRPLATGDTISLTLTFEQAGDVTIEVPVDNERGLANP